MIKKILLLTTVLFMAATAHADWMEDAPDKYIPANTQKIISVDSPCNQDGEAFKDFIPRFRNDMAFRNSRVKFDTDDEMGKLSFKMLKDYNNGKGYQLLKAFKKNLKCDKSYGTWYNISADEVCFRYMEELPCSEWGGSSFTARFQRIDGKWYLTGIMMAG